VTDRRTDGQPGEQNYDSQDRANIAASRGKNGNSLNSGCVFIDRMEQEGQHPLTGQRAANFRLLANQ